MENEFVRNGNKVLPKSVGLDYTLESGKVYRLKPSTFFSPEYLEICNDLILPKNYYSSKEDNKFINKVITYYNDSDKQTLGVMLHGLKGSGKSVMAKRIALDSKLPIIIVDPQFKTRFLERFFSSTKQEVCLLFDEFDKSDGNWDSKDILGFLDGISTSCKKLVIFTCNEEDRLSAYIKDRCSRIRYFKTFTSLSKDSIVELSNRILKDTSKANDVAKFICNNFKVRSYDNVASFLEEINYNDTEDLNELLLDLNINTK